MNNNLVFARTCVYNINYHVVWSVKYRKKILTAEIEQQMKEWAAESAEKNGFTIHLFEVGEMDHVHCFVSAPPTKPITEIVKAMKGITGRRLFVYHPELKKQLWKGVVWNHSYYVETIGSISQETIKKYIMRQEKSY